MRTKQLDMDSKSIHRTLLDGPLQGSNRMKLPFMPTPEHPMIISASEIGSFLRCRLQWNWKYRVGLETKISGAPRAIGTYVHAGKDLWYQQPRAKRTPKMMAKLARKAIRDAKLKNVDAKDRRLAEAMLVGFAEWATGNHDKSDRAIGKRDVMPEWAFCLPLFKDRSVFVRGYIDERFKPTTYKNTLAMDESKTRKDLKMDMLDLNNQITVYLWAMQKEFPGFERYLGWRTAMRRQMPGPRVKAPLFAREFVERDEEELRMWELDTRRIVKDMLDAAIYPTKTDHCRWDCDFYKLCLIRANKADLKSIIRSEYNAK